MKKIGIITHYYGSTNYGGLLQAYALCKKLNDLGYYAEQIQYLHEENNNSNVDNSKYIFIRIIKGILFRFSKIINRSFYKNMQLRTAALRDFRENIPHSRYVYTKNNIYMSNNEYDIFITGSDQVWNMDWYDAAYFLTFVNNKKKKYSYAASLGTDSISKERINILRENLKGYAAISVREEDSVDILKSIINQEIEYDLDPTLILTQEEWNKISSKKLIDKKYVFCYFLGDNEEDRKLAMEYAKNKGLQVVTLPYLNGQKRKCDDDFVAIKLYNISPGDFVSLIKYSQAVFTDSFHATVFSNIYDKNFFVFARKNGEKMSNRIISLTTLFDNKERFCNSEEKRNYKYFCSIESNGNSRKIYEKQLKKSIEYLKTI